MGISIVLVLLKVIVFTIMELSCLDYLVPTSTDLAVLKLSPNGVPLWSRRFSGNGYSQGNDLDLDNDNNVYVVGYYNDSVDFDPSIGVYNQISIDDEDAFILKLDSLGNFLWVKSYSAIGREALSGVKTDALGNVFVSGKFQTTLSINSLGTLISNGTDDILILKLDSSGNEIMYRQIGGTQWDVSDKIVMDDAGFLYLNGYFNDTVDFDPSPAILNKSSNGATDSYFMKFNSQLNLIWAQTIGGPCNYDYIRSIHIDDYNKLYITGAFDYGSIDFDWGTGTTAISSNAPACNSFNSFVLKANQGVCDYVSINIDSLRAVSCNLQGYIDVSANTTGLPVNYSWFPAISTDTIASFSSAGIYTVNIVDANSCIKSLSLLLGEPVDYSGYDLSSNWVNTNFRSGNISMIFVDGFNDGCLPVSGNLKVVLDTLVNYVNAQPIPDNIIGDTLIWNFTNLTYDSVHVTPEIIVYTPTWASIGDTVCFKTIISPQVGDIDTTNNIKQYCIPVLNGYDPNDKKVYPIGICTPRYINEDELLTYTVRFQNTGNASAIDVYILDTLDTDLNLNTVRVIGNSHAVITEVLPGNVLKFRFDNINLADSASNEAASHGYVIFEVLPNTGLSNGTTITNKVGIYFDFNPPIFTNTVLNTISDGTVNTNVSAIGNTISASLAGVSYQWLNCDNSNSVIAGATNQSYTAMTSGNYSVIINDGCFVDTSACVSIFVTGISEVENNNQFSFYPNPSTNTITITTIEPTQLKIINMLGEVVLEKQVQNNSIIDINNLSNGIYFIQTKEGYSTKLIKN
jgi:uncharacterized repeat protein (TIGR01451 family)